MSPAQFCLKNSLKLSAIALSTVLAGCSLNPWANDEEVAVPVGQSSAPRSESSSMNTGRNSQQTYNQPVLQKVSDPVPLAEGHPNEYTVKEGDTLWDIASVFLRDPWYWPEVWYVNPQVENPHLIYPGDVLSLVYMEGRQRIVNTPISAYRLSPQARVTPLDEAIESIPYEQIAAFLSRGVVLEKGQAERLPYVLQVRGDHLVGAAGNDVYVRGGEAAPTGTRYTLIHVGDKLIDPDDGKVVGYHGIHVGEGALARGGDPSTLSVYETSREVLEGDRLLPETVEIPLNFFPKAPSIPVEGRIISVVGGVSLIGQYQVVILNRGARDGIAPGDVLTVFQAGEKVKDRYGGRFLIGGNVQLPDEEAGTVMVFKTYDRIGYGLVMEATDAIRVHDMVRNPN